ncbi:MAG: hypothetical protein WAU56_00790 [Steroidobacteraceae bacterium]
MPDRKLRFVLQAIDPSTASVVLDAAFAVRDLQELCTQLSVDSREFDPNAEYKLERLDVERIKNHFKIEFEPDDFQVRIRPWRPTDALPYKVHTNRELALMLAGTKPLAAFVGEHPRNAEVEDVPERMFEPYVRSGRFVKREYVYSSRTLSAQGRTLRRVLYAQANQQWRIDAYLLLHETAERSGWNEGFERMEGSLLGYEDWQNDAYIELNYRSPQHSGPK